MKQTVWVLMLMSAFALGLQSVNAANFPAANSSPAAYDSTEAQSDWVELGEIIMQPNDKRAILYVKVIDRVSFYRVAIDGHYYAVTRNKKTDGWWYERAVTHTHTANGYYFNVPN